MSVRDNAAPIVPAPNPAPVPKEVEVTVTGHLEEVSVTYTPRIQTSEVVLGQACKDWMKALSSPDSPENRALFLRARTQMNDAEKIYLGFRPGMQLQARPHNAAKLPAAVRSMIRVAPLVLGVAPIALDGIDVPAIDKANGYLHHIREVQSVNRPHTNALEVVASLVEQNLDSSARTFHDRVTQLTSHHFEINEKLAPLREFISSPAEEAQETRKKIAKALSTQKTPPKAAVEPEKAPTPAVPPPPDPRSRI